jgi:hypothetical protein
MSQRERYLSDPAVQWTLIRHVMLHWSMTLLSLIAIGILAQMFFGGKNQSFVETVGVSFSQQTPLLLVMFMLIPVYLRDVLKVSNRFAGPMKRLRATLRDLADGKVGQRMKFRPGDFWQETAEDFNRFYAKYNELKRRCEELEQRLAEREDLGSETAVEQKSAAELSV